MSSYHFKNWKSIDKSSIEKGSDLLLHFFLPGPIDLAILIDSGSYYGKQWNMMTDFVRELLGSMAFGSEFTQVTRQFT